MGVQRYSPACVKDSTGDWVEYDDYAKLLTKITELEEAAEDYRQIVNDRRDKIDELEHLVDRLKDQISGLTRALATAGER